MNDAALLEAMRAAVTKLQHDPDPLAALALMRPHLAWPATAARQRFAQAFGVFRAVAHGLGGARLSDPVHPAAQHPDDPDALRELGLLLLAQGLPDIAATVLQQLEDLQPGEPRDVEALVTALGDAGHHEAAARQVMRSPRLLEDPVFLWLVGYHSVMAGDVMGARAVQPTLASLADDEQTRYWAELLADMLARHTALEAHGGIDGSDLVGWHLVTTGSLLMHRAPGTIGRYGGLAEAPEHLLEGVRTVELLVKACQLSAPNVYYMPELPSAVLGKALGLALDVPALPWRGQDEDGIIVADDLGRLAGDTLALLRHKRPGQVLWSHACCWHVPQPVCADLITLLYGARQPAFTAGDTDELAQQVLTCELPEGAGRDKARLLALVRLDAPENGRPMALRGTALRSRFWAASPVSTGK